MNGHFQVEQESLRDADINESGLEESLAGHSGEPQYPCGSVGRYLQVKAEDEKEERLKLEQESLEEESRLEQLERKAYELMLKTDKTLMVKWRPTSGHIL